MSSPPSSRALTALASASLAAEHGAQADPGVVALQLLVGVPKGLHGAAPSVTASVRASWAALVSTAQSTSTSSTVPACWPCSCASISWRAALRLASVTSMPRSSTASSTQLLADEPAEYLGEAGHLEGVVRAHALHCGLLGARLATRGLEQREHLVGGDRGAVDLGGRGRADRAGAGAGARADGEQHNQEHRHGRRRRRDRQVHGDRMLARATTARHRGRVGDVDTAHRHRLEPVPVVDKSQGSR